MAADPRPDHVAAPERPEELIRAALRVCAESHCGSRERQFPNAALAALDVLLAERQQLREALEAIANGTVLTTEFRAHARAALAAAGEPSQDRETTGDGDAPCPMCGATPDEPPNDGCPVCAGIIDFPGAAVRVPARETPPATVRGTDGRDYPASLVHGEMCASRFSLSAACDCGKSESARSDTFTVTPTMTSAAPAEPATPPDQWVA